MHRLKRLFRVLLATLLSLVLTYAFYVVLDFNAFDYISPQDGEADVVNLFYRIGNGVDPDRQIPPEDGVVIFDLNGETSRSRIADALARICALNPRKVVIDVIFPAAATIPPAESDSLQRVVAACASRIVTACRVVGDGRVEHSFYTLPLGIPYGAANNSLFYCRPDVPVFEGCALPALAFAAVDAASPPDTDRYVDFREKRFLKLDFNDLDKLDRPSVEDRIVIVGDTRDKRDFKDLPFPVDGLRRVPGVTILAYTVAAFLHDGWVGRSPDWVGWTVAAVLTLLFVGLCYWIGGRPWPASAGSLFVRALRFFVVAVLLVIAYLVFMHSGIIVNLVYAMIAVAMSGFAIDAVDCGERLLGWCRNRKTVSQ